MSTPVKVASRRDLPPGTCRAVLVGGRSLAIVNVEGVLYALEGDCTHAGGSLGDGFLQGKSLICPLHGATFDVATGAATGPPAYDDVDTFSVRLDGDDILVEL